MHWEVIRHLAQVDVDRAHRRFLPEHELPRGPVLVVGHHAAFARTPRAGTALAAFPFAADLAETRFTPMGLVRIEQAIERLVVNEDGTTRFWWEEAVFPGHPNGILWLLLPAERDRATGRWVIAPGSWTAGARWAMLPRQVHAHVPGAPKTVALYDHDPHTGQRWPS
ncbi:hypothetical protein ACWDYH_37750 [Nocardia goodfellowii]